MLVRDIMTPNPITIRPESDYLAAIAIMRAGRFRRLPVVDAQGKLVGIVTFEKLSTIQTQHTEEVSKQLAIQGDGVLVRVRDVMTSPVISTIPDYPLEEAARLMVKHRITSLPVMDGGRVVGIVTATDIFETFASVLGGGSATARLSVEVDNRPGQLAELAGRVAAIGGNILSIASHPASTPDRMNFTLRVESVALDDLLDAVQAHPGLVVRSAWEPPTPG